MRIISINAEKTPNDKAVAFNLDAPMTDEVLSQLIYGNLSFSRIDDCLMVQRPDGSQPLNQDTIATLNGKLRDIESEAGKKAKRRQVTLDNLVRDTGLPLA